MSDSLLRFYEGELHFIRKLARHFARRYPAAATRLQLEPDRSADPHVERLIESFALVTARVQQKIHDEFPELTDALLSVLYPHFLAPVPSTTLLQFELDPTRGNPQGVRIEAGSGVHTPPVGGVPCRYRTSYPVTLWPIAVEEARLAPPPFPPGLNAPPRALAALRIVFAARGELNFAQMAIGKLRLCLHGDALVSGPLYELLMNNTLQVVLRPLDLKAAVAPVVLTPDEALSPVGFGLDEGVLPYPAHAFPGYRLLTEFFAFPWKFLFADLAGWERVRALGPGRRVEAVFFLSRGHPRLEHLLDANAFRTGCTPAINLFERGVEPQPIGHTRHEYRLTPEVGQPLGYEIYSVDSVTAAGPDGGDRDYRPFYQLRHGGDRAGVRAFWYASREPSLMEGDRGTDVLLRLVDLGFDPAEPADDVLVVRATCTNRDLPARLPRVGEAVPFEPEFAAPGTRLRCLRNPTPPLRPPLRRGQYWRLVSQLSLNHLSIGEGPEAREALQELLRLYDFSDPDAEPQLAAVARQVVDGITDLRSRRVVGWTGGPTGGGFCRGVEVTVELDEARYVGTSAYLFASVLERFFALYVSINSFSQLAARLKQHDGDLKRWPPRAGERPLL